VAQDPLSLKGILPGIEEADNLPEMLAGVKQINDLDSTRKMHIGKIPNPWGSVGHDDFLDGSTPTAILGFGIEAFAEFLRRLDGSGVGG